MTEQSNDTRKMLKTSAILLNAIEGMEGFESDREQRKTSRAGEYKSEQYQPGSYGCHELLHVVSVMQSGIDDFILDHPSCFENEEWFMLASLAMSSICLLYQSIGEAHIPVIGVKEASTDNKSE